MFLDNVIDIPVIKNCIGIFRDRDHAGKILANMIDTHINKDAIVFAIPAGGVPVASTLALKLGLRLDLVVVSKITLLWNSEAGYGAAAFDGTVEINPEVVSSDWTYKGSDQSWCGNSVKEGTKTGLKNFVRI